MAAVVDPDHPRYDPHLWVGGEGAFPAGGEAFGSSVTSSGGQFR